MPSQPRVDFLDQTRPLILRQYINLGFTIIPQPLKQLNQEMVCIVDLRISILEDKD